jgi:hypothetical protein
LADYDRLLGKLARTCVARDANIAKIAKIRPRPIYVFFPTMATSCFRFGGVVKFGDLWARNPVKVRKADPLTSGAV